GTTMFLTRIRGVSPSLNRILQTVSTRQTLMRLMSSAAFASDHSRGFWSSDNCRSTCSPGLVVFIWPGAVLDGLAAALDGVAVALKGLLNGLLAIGLFVVLT